MRFTNKFPYTNINNINLDWIIKRVKELGETVLSYAADIANAVALAETAQETADSVSGTAESAVTTAQAAEATANAIAGTANTALATAQTAEETAEAAEETANAIAGTANTALAAAQAAEETAQAAEETAQAAEETAQAAETTANTAAANVAGAVQTANTALATADAASSRAALANSTANEALSTARAAQTSADETASDVAFLTDEVSEQKNAIEAVEASLATVETTGTASRAYAVGELLVYNNRLYRVVSVIAAGSTLTPSTNIVQTTVEDELDDLQTGIVAIGLNKSFGQFLCDNILCPDYSVLTSGRQLTKQGNFFKQEYVSSNGSTVNIVFTGEYHRGTGSVNDMPIPDECKIPVSFLSAQSGFKVVLKYYLYCVYTGTSTGRYYIAWFDAEGNRTVEQIFDIRDRASGVFDLTIPATAVSFCLVARSTGAGTAHQALIDFDIVSI